MLGYKCECLGDSYFGQHCEATSSRTVLLQTISRSSAYIAIIAIATVAVFIVTMDVLRYGFRIDPVHEGEVKKKFEAPICLRLVYVNPPVP